MCHVTNLPLWKSRPFFEDFNLDLDFKWVSGSLNGRDWSLTYEKIIRKSLHKTQMLCLCFCSQCKTTRKKKINNCASICIHQGLRNVFNFTHLIILKRMVYFCHLNHFSQFFAQVPQSFCYCFLNFLIYFDPNYLSPAMIFRMLDNLS